MSLFKLFTRGFAALAVSAALSAFAAETTHSAAGASATCKQARQDLNFLQQLAMTDGGPGPLFDTPTPAACKAVGQSAKENAARESQSAGRTADGSPPAARRYN